jgi:hypothetical protein
MSPIVNQSGSFNLFSSESDIAEKIRFVDTATIDDRFQFDLRNPLRVAFLRALHKSVH